MTYLLPNLLKEVTGFLSNLPKRAKYKLAIVLDILLIAAILLTGKQPVQRLISPWVSPAHSIYAFTQNIANPQTFAFVPDLARNKFPRVETKNLTYLSFFDVPLDEDGQINYYSRGYTSFTSVEAQNLFERARQTNTKIFLTISAMDRDIIRNLLDNPQAQNTLSDQIIWELQNSNIDGITIDFEYPNGEGSRYQEKFTKFIQHLVDNVHTVPQAQIAVALPSELTDNQSLYNMEDLGQSADRIFLIASNFIVPETKNASLANPVFGFEDFEYFKGVSNILNSLKIKIPADKLAVERAWYGNGHNYPLYRPDQNPPQEDSRQSSGVALDKDTIEQLVAGVPQKGKQGARKNIPIIVNALKKEGILDSNVLAYALATVEHETDETFEPIEEIQGKLNARRFGYEGGSNYFGRGFIQITHLRNYREFGKRIGIGLELVKNPGLAKDPEVAAKILAAYFKDNNVANLASQGYYVAARTPINPDYNGYSVAQLAYKYEI